MYLSVCTLYLRDCSPTIIIIIIIIIILGIIRGQGGPSVQLYCEEYIHNIMFEETDSIEDEITLQKRLYHCTNQELEWLKNNNSSEAGDVGTFPSDGFD